VLSLAIVVHLLKSGFFKRGKRSDYNSRYVRHCKLLRSRRAKFSRFCTSKSVMVASHLKRKAQIDNNSNTMRSQGFLQMF